MGDDVRPGPDVVVGLQRIQAGTTDAVLELHLLQRERRRRLEGGPPQPTVTEIRHGLDRLTASGPAFVASVDGRIHACAFPSVEIYQPDDDGLAYFQRVSGVAHGLAVRDDTRECHAAFAALVKQMTGWWAEAGATGGKLVWPVADVDLEPELSASGITPDAYIKHRGGNVGTDTDRRGAGAVRIRLARHDDLAAAVALNSMVLDEHVWVSPFARWVPRVEERFTSRFLAAMVVQQPQRSLFYVAELDDQIAAMAECEVETHSGGLDATFPAGTMGYVHVFGVDKNMRRRRVGTALAAFILDDLRSRGAAGVRLLVSHYNHPSRMFWRHMGFGEVWRLYQTHQLTAGTGA